jgi:hypothetical protein
VVEEDDMSGLLTAEGVPADLHVLQHIAVAHPGLADHDPLAVHGLQHPQVAHHRGYQGVLRERAAFPQGQREDAHDLVAVDDVASPVHGQAPVGVAVVGDAQLGAILNDGPLQPGEVR